MPILDYFWDGPTYTAGNFGGQFNTFLMRGDTYPRYVLAGYYLDLDVVSLAANAIVIGPGAAFVNGNMYVNTENVSLTTSTAGGAARNDMICVTLNTAAQTMRLTLTEGSVAPSNDQLLLYTIRRPVGQATPVDLDIADKRVFAVGQDYLNYYNLDNLIPNSEFLAFSGISTAGADAPDYWYTVGAPTTIASAAVSGVYTSWRRGRAIQITGNANTGMGISIPLMQNYGVATRRGYEVYTLTGRVVVAAGSARVKLSILSAPGTATPYSEEKEVDIYSTGDFVLRVKYSGNVALANDMHLNVLLTCSSAASDVTFGPIKASFGYVTGPVDNGSSDILMFNDVVTDANWNGTVGYSTSTNVINLDANFSTVAPTQIKGAILRVRVRDSGSAAAANCSCSIKSSNLFTFCIIHLEGAANDTWMERIVYVPTMEWSNAALTYPANVRFTADLVATGVGTMDVYIGVIGFIV